MASQLASVINNWQQAQQAAAPDVNYKRLFTDLDTKYDTWKSGLTDAQVRARDSITSLLADNGYTPDQFSSLLDEQLNNVVYGIADPGDPSSKLQYVLKDEAKKPDAELQKWQASINGTPWSEDTSNFYRPAFQRSYKSLSADDYANLAAPNTLFNPDSIASAIMNRIAVKQAHAPDPVTGQTPQQAQTDYTGKVNALKQQYDPYSLFGTVNPDNAVIQSILGTGYNDAATQIQNAYKRGTLNDVGSSRAMSELGNQRAAGSQLLTRNANDIYTQNRQSITDLLSKADAGLDAFKTTNTPFNFDSISKQIGDTATNLQSGFEGALRNSATGQQFFDATKAINVAGGVQGGVNPITKQDDSLASAISSMNKKNSQPRTLGNTGAF